MELDLRNIIVLTSMAINLPLLWVLFRYGRKTPGGQAYSVAILAIVGWIVPMFLFRVHAFGLVDVWARLLYVMATFTATSFFYFTAVFPENSRIPWWAQIFLVFENLFIVWLVLHPTLFIQGVEVMTQGEDVILWGPAYPLYTLHFSVLFMSGFLLLFIKMRRLMGTQRKQVLFILLGYFFGANLAMTTNLILPWFGYFELNWFGQFSSTLVAVFTTYGIFKYQLLDIKVIATEGFILILNLFILFQFITSKDVSQFMLNGVIFVGVLGISVLLVRSVHREVARREELAHLAQSLEKANIRLQELDRQKTEFLSIASHQIRTPLSIIKGYIELIKDGAYGKPTKKMVQTLDDMDKSNERLVKLIDEFLDISRIEQGRTKFVFGMFDMQMLISDVVGELTDRAHEKKLKIFWKAEKKHPQVYMDDEKIRHVVFNFIDNAIKYSDKGSITVTLKSEKQGVSFRVKDHGLGFEKTDEVNFFQKFYRGTNVEGKNVNGTGLGIYVCRKFIEKHEGKVWARSRGLGKGGEFGFWIPSKKRVIKVKHEEIHEVSHGSPPSSG